MNLWIKEHRVHVFFILLVFEVFAMNYAHPITPTLLKDLNMPSYMFGYAFAAMAFTNFLFSPFWGDMIGKIGSKKVLAISSCGYALGQFIFGAALNIPMILLARVVSGFFAGGLNVAFLTYVINFSDESQRGKNLTIQVTLSAVSNAFGFLIGGLLGDISLPVTFAAQVIQLVVVGILFYLLLGDDAQPDIETTKGSLLKKMNPLQSFINAKPYITKTLMILLVVVLLTGVASTAYDQCFNYFIKDQYNFPPSYNGLLKAILGFITLITNSFISLRIIRQNKTSKALVIVLLGCTVTMLGITLFSDITTFIITNIIFFVFNAIYVPLLQDMVAGTTHKEHTGKIMGVYNSMKFLGNVFGALFAGMIYGYGAKLSFAYACLFFFISMLIAYYYVKRYQKQKLSLN